MVIYCSIFITLPPGCPGVHPGMEGQIQVLAGQAPFNQILVPLLSTLWPVKPPGKMIYLEMYNILCWIHHLHLLIFKNTIWQLSVNGFEWAIILHGTLRQSLPKWSTWLCTASVLPTNIRLACKIMSIQHSSLLGAAVSAEKCLITMGLSMTGEQWHCSTNNDNNNHVWFLQTNLYFHAIFQNLICGVFQNISFTNSAVIVWII
jgi:hypothetical protein